MSTSFLTEHKLFGLFELDPAGKVLYFRTEPEGDSDCVSPADLAGRNFFDEVASFENVEEFRRRIGSFTHSNGQADNFNFTCRLNNGLLPVRVLLLARIGERSDGKHKKSILVHIRKVIA
jgi:hypothetical protein